jgi:mono/diheme cytochrome c family protein
MKKAVVIVVLVLFVFACHRKTVVSAESTTNDAELSILVQKGKTIYTTRCTKCHGLKPVNHYTANSWNKILSSMVPKAKLSQEEADQVNAYVMAYSKK